MAKLSIISSLCAAASCAASPAAAVVGASGDASVFADEIVMVLTRGPEGSGFCSGIVLSSRIVLTAAHCLRAPADMRVHFRDASGQPFVLEVAATLAHPDFRPDAQARRMRSLDVGLVETRDALPDVFRPATLADGDPPAPGDRVDAVGFGISREGDAKSGGRLREAKLQVREPRSRVLLWAAPTEGDAGACAGDSGGPIFDAEGKSVVAVVAWTEGRGAAKCGRLTQGVLVGPIADWLRAGMRRLTGGIAPTSGN